VLAGAPGSEEKVRGSGSERRRSSVPPDEEPAQEVGDMVLKGKTIVSALRAPYPYGGEFVSRFLFALRGS